MKLPALWIRLLAVALATVALTVSGCKSKGSYEFKPGRGWVPN